jgi:hypothetical protein
MWLTKFVAIAAILLGVAALSVTPSLAAKGGGQSLTATISLNSETHAAATSGAPMVYGDAVFTVTRSVPYDKDTIWVTNKCWDATGNLVQRQDNPVLWGTTVSLVGTTWPFPTEDGVTCTAYVTLRPWQDRPLGDAILSYPVGQ